MKIQANPALLVPLSKAASVLHVVTGEGILEIRRFPPVLVTALLVAWDWVCALLHSRANVIAFVATSLGVNKRFSNNKVFLADQRAQQTHGRMFVVIPDGGRHVVCLKATTASLNSIPVAR